MQLVQVIVLAVLVYAAMEAVLMRASRHGDLNLPPIQTIVGIFIGLFAAFIVLVMLSDAVPDPIEWIGTAGLTIAAVVTVGLLWFRTSR